MDGECRGFGIEGRQKKSSFCEQKEAKKLYQLEVSMPRHPDVNDAAPNSQRFFAAFFQKRRPSLAFLDVGLK